MTADDARQQLREEIARTLHATTCPPGPVCYGCQDDADALLAGPLADLLADRARVQRVRELHKGVCNWDAPECEACSWHDDDGCSYYAPAPCPTIRALDGDQS